MDRERLCRSCNPCRFCTRGSGHGVSRRRPGSPVLEEHRYMLHVTCDHCGKQLRAGEEHYVVKIEVFAAHDPGEITEEDLEEDHMEAVSQLLREMEESDEADAVEPTLRHFR